MWNNANPVLVGASGDLPFWDHMGWGWMSGFHGLFWLLIAVVTAASLVVSFRLATRYGGRAEEASGSSSRGRWKTARDLLDARYARGEIDRSEYLKRKRELS